MKHLSLAAAIVILYWYPFETPHFALDGLRAEEIAAHFGAPEEKVRRALKQLQRAHLLVDLGERGWVRGVP